MTGPVVLLITVACGVIFWRFVVWASGLDARAQEQARVDAEFARIVEELSK